MKKLQYILLSIASVSCISLKAQEQKRFNALDYSMQKRWKSPDAEFVNNRILDNTYISVFGTMEKIFPQGNYKYDTGNGFGFAIGKQVSKRTQLQIGLKTMKFIDKSNDKAMSNLSYNARFNQEMKHTGIFADHIYNLSSYLFGYNPYRRFEFSTIAGVGYTISKENYQNYKLKNYIFDIHAGVQLRMRTNSPIDIIFEPRLTAYNDAVDFSSNSNWNRFDYAVSGSIGLAYNFYHKGFTRKDGSKPNTLKGLFFDISTGIATQNSYKYEFNGGKISGTSYGNFLTMTPTANIGIGKWLTNSFALRLAAESYSVLWHGISFDGYHNNQGAYDVVNYRTVYYNHTRYETSTYTSIGIEAMLAPLKWFKSSSEQSKFDANILFGGKLGKMDKKNYVSSAQNIKDGFNGITAAIRLKTKLTDGVSLYVEPRYNINYYEVVSQSKNTQSSRETFSDKQYLALFGIEVENSETSNKKDDIFRPHPFVSISGGAAMSMQDQRFSNKSITDIAYSGAIGYSLTKLSSFQINVENKQVAREIILDNSDQYTSNKYAMLSVGLDYMLNVTNLVAGYDKDRKIDLNLFGGPNINLHSKDMKYQVPYLDKDGNTLYEEFTEEAQKSSIGYELGGQISYKLTKNIGLNFNVKFHKYNGDVIDKNIEKATEEFETKYHYIVSGATKVDRVITYQIGASYSF